MSLSATLAERKRQLLHQLGQPDLAKCERDDLERLLIKIDTALSLLEPPPNEDATPDD